MTWYKLPALSRDKFVTLEHSSGWRIQHCGHPTANWPYYLSAPEGREVIVSHNGRGFRDLKTCKAVVAHILCGDFHVTTENCDPGIAVVRNVTAYGEELEEK